MLPNPIIAYIKAGGLFKWVKQIGPADKYDAVQQVRFNNDKSKVVSVLKEMAIVIFDSSDGSFIRKYKLNEEVSSTMSTDGFVLDLTDKVYFAMQSGDFRWQVIGLDLSILAVSPQTPFLFLNAQTMPSAANAIVLDQTLTNLYIGGYQRHILSSGESQMYANIARISLIEGRVAANFGIVQAYSSQYLMVRKMAYQRTSSTDRLFVCLDQGTIQDDPAQIRMRVGRIDFGNSISYRFADFPQIGVSSSSNSYRCMHLSALSSTTMIVLFHDVNLQESYYAEIQTNTASWPQGSLRYFKLGFFTDNFVTNGYFSYGYKLYIGQATSITPLPTFSTAANKNFAYVMTLDYNTKFSACYSTLADTLIITDLDTASIKAGQIVESYDSISQDLITTVVTQSEIARTNTIANSGNCLPYPNAGISGSLVGQNYQIYSGAQEYQFTEFTTNLNNCNDLVFQYELMSPPYFVTLNANDRKIIISSSNEADVDIHQIKLTVTLPNAQSIVSVLILTVTSPCTTMTIPLVSAITNINYYVGSVQTSAQPVPLINPTIPQCTLTHSLEWYTGAGTWIPNPTAFITFVPESQRTYVYTYEDAHILNYNMRIVTQVVANSSIVKYTPFTISIKSACETAQVIPEVQQNIYIKVPNAMVESIPLNWKHDQPFCKEPIKYSVMQAPADGLPVTVSIDPSTNSLVIPSNSNSTQTSIQVNITGYINNYPQSNLVISFNISFVTTSDCLPLMVTPGSLLYKHFYFIGDPALKITIPEWKSAINYNPPCTVFSYNAIVALMPGMPEVNVVRSYDNALRQLSFYTSDFSNNNALYQYNVSATSYGSDGFTQELLNYQSFYVTMLNPCLAPYSTFKPVVPGATISDIYTYYITDPELVVVFPEYEIEPYYSICGSSTYSLVRTNGDQLTALPDLWSFDSNTRTLRVQNEVQSYAGSHQMKFTVSKSGHQVSWTKYFHIQIVATCSHNKIKPSNAKNLRVKIGVAMEMGLGFETQVVTCNFDRFECQSVSGSLACDPTIYSFPSIGKIKIYTNDYNLYGKVHQMTIFGHLATLFDMTGMPLTITFTSDLCQNAYIISYPIQSTSYDISYGTRRTISTLRWEQSDPQCPSITYELKDNDSPSVDSDVFRIDPVTFELSIITTSASKARVYNLYVLATMGPFTERQDFRVTVTNQCPNARITAPVIPSTLTFEISSTSLPTILTVPEWSVNLLFCGTFTYTLTKKDGSQLDPFVSFDSTERQIQISTTNPNHVGKYQYQLTGKLPLKSMSQQFTIEVSYPCGQAKVITSAIPDAIYNIGSGQKVIQFEPFSESVGTCGVVKVEAQLGLGEALPSYVKFDEQQKLFTIDTSDKQLDGKSIKITLKGTLLLTKVTASSLPFNIDFITLTEEDELLSDILSSSENSTANGVNGTLSTSQSSKPNKKTSVKKIRPILNATITDLDFSQTLTIQFSEEMLQLPRLDIIQKTNSLAFNVIQAESGLSFRDMISSWQVVSYSGYILVIQLKFSKPDKISLGRVYDKLTVTFRQTALFLNEDQDKSIPPGYVMTRIIPPQLSNSTATKMLQSVTVAATKTLTSSVSINLILSIFLGVSLKKVWMLMNTLQILTNLPLLSVALPSNSLFLFQALVDLAKFNFIPKDKIKSFFKTLHLIPEKSESKSRILEESKTVTDGTEVKDNFKVMGIEDTNIFQNMGVLLLALLGFVAFGIILLLLRFLIMRFECMRKFYTKIHQMLFFNSFLRSITKGYLNFTLATLLAINSFSAESTKDRVVTLAMLIFLLVFPIFSLIFLTRNLQKLDDTDFRLRYGSLYLNLRTNNKQAMQHVVFYFFRRLLYCISIIFLGDYPGIQFVVLVTSCTVLLAYQVSVLPIDDKQAQIMEIYNESSILMVCCMLAPFLADSFDEETIDVRNIYGWMIVGITLMNVIVNQGSMLISVAIRLYEVIKSLVQKCRAKCADSKAKKGVEQFSSINSEILPSDNTGPLQPSGTTLFLNSSSPDRLFEKNNPYNTTDDQLSVTNQDMLKLNYSTYFDQTQNNQSVAELRLTKHQQASKQKPSRKWETNFDMDDSHVGVHIIDQQEQRNQDFAELGKQMMAKQVSNNIEIVDYQFNERRQTSQQPGVDPYTYQQQIKEVFGTNKQIDYSEQTNNNNFSERASNNPYYIGQQQEISNNYFEENSNNTSIVASEINFESIIQDKLKKKRQEGNESDPYSNANRRVLNKWN